MKKILTLFIIILLVSKVMMAQDKPTKFINYTTPGFSIKLPDTAQYGGINRQSNKVRIPGGDVATEAWSISSGLGLFSFSSADFPEAVVNKKTPSAFLNEGRNGLVNQLKGTIASEKAITLNNYPGIRYQVTSDNGTVDAINVFAGTKLYTVLVLYSNPESVKDSETFLNSFHLR